MTKKIFIVLLFFSMFNKNVISMDCSSKQTIDYNHFFNLCKKPHDGNSELERFLFFHPEINIDYQNEHGATAVLYAAANKKWERVWWLLKSYNANKMASDKYGRTLFSHAVYYPYGLNFQSILRFYSLDELNALSKKFVMLKTSEKDMNFYDSLVTPLHKACLWNNIPLIFKLLEEGARLDAPDKNGRTPYDYLKGDKRLLTSFMGFPFIAREACNNGSSLPMVPMALICAVLEKNVDCDAGRLIKEMYVKEKLQETSFLSSAKACIWKPVCVDACVIAGLIKKDEKVNEQHCLTQLMLMPQQKLTKINKKLAFKEIGL